MRTEARARWAAAVAVQAVRRGHVVRAARRAEAAAAAAAAAEAAANSRRGRVRAFLRRFRRRRRFVVFGKRMNDE